MPTRRTMRLDELVGAPAGAAAGHAAGDADGFPPPVEIGSLAYDSSRVQPGALFFCVPGLRHDGHDFAPDALARGAVALVVEHPLGLGVPEIVVPSARGAMGPMAARFYGEPSAALSLIGVTGTNGKTTTAFMVRKLLECAGERCGLLGTVKSVIGGTERPAGRTTPEAIDLQGDLRAMLDGGDGACAMEVSSHALALGRTSALRFAVAIFTNLTQDHLDFHRDMEEYFQAKRALFVPGRDGALDGVGRQAAGAPAAGARIGGPPAAVPADTRPVAPSHSVINVGDPYGRRLAAELSGAITFAVLADGREDEEDGDAALASADFRALDVRCDAAGSHFTLVHPEGRCEVTMAMPGRFNVANALGAIAAARALGVALAPMLERLERPIAVPGRFERVD
ncbi:MAG: UDP-N-acetylmuramoyl-L-alanyl-D-glutamate--2,6-diaminopimelate ligase, partial [Acidobacteriota bacterium]|nr:UDP-N-acetylmuramoyl-L-alanyl-D-glutamate--2,6-diaminopimelate ligase [Acidobacteriota bacterium]